MLAADKDRLIAGAKQTALQLRHWKYMEPVFYTAGSCTMACALYTLCVSSFAMVYGHRLALQGPTGSVERAVAVMMKSRTSIFVSFALAMFFLIVAASAMAWVKMGDAAAVVTGIFGLLFLILFCEHQRMKSAFRIDPEQMVQGDVRLQVGVTDVDISTLEAGFGGGGTAAAPPARGSSSHRDALLDGSGLHLARRALLVAEAGAVIVHELIRLPPREGRARHGLSSERARKGQSGLVQSGLVRACPWRAAALALK